MITQKFIKLKSLLIKLIQIKDSNLLACVNEKGLYLIDLSKIEENKKGKKITKIKIDNDEQNLFYDLIKINDEILLMQ